jgi:hypothetical protein
LIIVGSLVFFAAIAKEDGYPTLFDQERIPDSPQKYNYSMYLLYLWSADRGE